VEFVIQTSGTYEEVLEVARFSEQAGLPAVALPDHYLLGRNEAAMATRPASDALIQLAGLARDTSRIGLVVLVSPVTFRHPAVLIKTAITIDRMSGGRFTLGLGTGWMDREHEVFGLPYPPRAERYAMLEEALAYCRAALADTPTGFDGAFYALEAFPLAPRPVGSVRLLVGGSGPHKTPRLAGAYADEFNVYMGDDLAGKIARARRAAADAGRDPDALVLSSASQVFAAPTEEELDVRLREFAAGIGTPVEELRDRLARAHTPVGTYVQLRDRFAELASLGITRYYVQGAFDRRRTPEMLEALGG
jgi:alkanesulfonate monooxygenase SsuD/methylene tetrahydromethanopterin reductase-like flavin-dependent oxidoreductase (luciferase family)